MTGDRFVRPSETIQDQDLFQGDEVGVNHPKTEAYVRLKNNGDIEIVAGDGLGIIMHRAGGTITLVADSVRILTRANGGLRWNDKLFNERAGSFQEATFVPVDEEGGFKLYRGVEHFIYDEDQETSDEEGQRPPGLLGQQYAPGHPFPNVKVSDPETGALITYRQYFAKYGKPPSFAADRRAVPHEES
jgi:hypothetical protein